MSVQLKIKVTKEILFKSRMCGGDIYNCAVALSIRDILPNAIVGPVYIYPCFNSGITIPLPKKATEYIFQFDFTSPEDRPRLPEIEFTITIPDEVIEQINIEELRPLLLNHPTLELC